MLLATKLEGAAGHEQGPLVSAAKQLRLATNTQSGFAPITFFPVSYGVCFSHQVNKRNVRLVLQFLLFFIAFVDEKFFGSHDARQRDTELRSGQTSSQTKTNTSRIEINTMGANFVAAGGPETERAYCT